jgi:hypothetical protein
MPGKRRVYGPPFKAKVALAAAPRGSGRPFADAAFAA